MNERPQQPDFDGQLRRLQESVSMIRGRGAYGRKPDRTVVQQIASVAPVTLHHYQPSTGETVLETVQDVGPILDAAKERRLSGHDGYNADKSMKLVAYLPQNVVEMLYRKGINPYSNEDWPRVAALLDSPDWAAWRTDGGRSKISKIRPRQYFRASTSSRASIAKGTG